MGKYMRKAKTTKEVAVMDLSLGVRTRAKTLALQRQAPLADSGGYLQLRSRRLEKPPIGVNDSRRQRQGSNKEGHQQNPNLKQQQSSKAGRRVRENSGSDKEREMEEDEKEEEEEKVGEDKEKKCSRNDDKEINELDIEDSFGENILDFEGRERGTRESTPCSLIRDPEIIRTPGSTTRTTSAGENNRRFQNSLLRHIPTTVEMDEFFAGAEEEQQKQFIKKYNFDPINDKPLPGRYDWERVDP